MHKAKRAKKTKKTTRPRRRRIVSPAVLMFEILNRIEQKLNRLLKQGRYIMGQSQAVIDYLKGLDALTNEIADDIDRILKAEDLSPEAKAAMAAHMDRLKAIASKSDLTLPPPVEPAV